MLDRDYSALIRSEIRSALTRANDYSLEDGEKMAEQEIRSYLKAMYDVDTIFVTYPEWSDGPTYEIDEVVRHRDHYWKATVQTTNQPEDSADWVLFTYRDRLLVMILIDIALYHLHAAVNPRAISDIRVKRYNDAIAWLKKVAKGELIPDLPAVATEDITTLNYGSRDKTSDRW